MNRELKKGLKDAKEGKITKVRSVEDVFKEPKSRIYKLYLYFYRLFWRIVRLPKDIRRYIRDFIQRGRRGWANSDTWSFEHYLSKIIAEGVKHLKEINYTLPTWKEGKTELECVNEWDVILNTIINTFQIAKEISEGKVYYLPLKEFTEKEYKRLVKSLQNSKYRMKVLNRKEVKEFEKGFDLFKEHFFSLQD